jgi:WD40 repeat protein
MKIRVWDLSSFSLMHPIFEPIPGLDAKKMAQLKNADFSKLALPSVNCLSFSTDGKKLLSCNQFGKVILWDVTNLGEEFQVLSSIRISEMGVLSVTCKLQIPNMILRVEL